MRFYITPCFDEFGKLLFAKLSLHGDSLPRNNPCRKPTAVGVDDITLTIVTDVPNSPLPKILLDLATIDIVRFITRQSLCRPRSFDPFSAC